MLTMYTYHIIFFIFNISIIISYCFVLFSLVNSHNSWKYLSDSELYKKENNNFNELDRRTVIFVSSDALQPCSFTVQSPSVEAPRPTQPCSPEVLHQGVVPSDRDKRRGEEGTWGGGGWGVCPMMLETRKVRRTAGWKVRRTGEGEVGCT